MNINYVIRLAAIVFTYLRKKDFYGHSSIVSYAAIFSVFPLMFLLATVLGTLAHEYGLYVQLLNSAQKMMPPAAYEIIIKNAQQVLPFHSLWLLGLSLVAALYSASRVVSTTVTQIYDLNGIRDRRTGINKTFTAIAFLLGFAISTAVAIALVLTVEVYLSTYIPVFTGRGLLLYTTEVVLYFIPFTLIITSFYHRAMSDQITFKDALPGAIFFVTMFVGVSQCLRLTVLFVDYNKTYGTIGGLILFLVWFRFIAFFLLAGSAVNIIIKHRTRYVG